MDKLRNHTRGNFTIVPNKLIEDTSMSDRSRFLYIYLSQKPGDWQFYTNQLCKSLGMHPDTFRKYRNELISKGWIFIEEQEIENGRFKSRIYHLYPEPYLSINGLEAKNSQDEKTRNFPSQKKTDTVNFRDGNTTTLTNTNYKQIKRGKNKNTNSLQETKNSISQNPTPRR